VTAAVFQVMTPLKLGAATPVLPELPLPLEPLVDVEPEDPDEPLVDPDALPDEPELPPVAALALVPLLDDVVVLLPEPALVPTPVLPEFPAGLVPDPPQPLTSVASAAAKMAEPFRACD